MKRIFNYFIFKINCLKIAIVFIIIFIFQFSLFLNLINNNIEINFYDLLMDSFGYLALFFSLSLFYLTIIYNTCDNTNFYKYLFLKFRSKYKVYIANVLVIFILAVILVSFINTISILESFSNMSFKNVWSPHFFNKMFGKGVNVFHSNESIKIITNKITPLTYIIYTNIFVILYLFFLGMLFYVSNLYFKKRAFSFIIVLVINIVSMCLDSVSIISKVTFTYNVYLLNASVSEVSNNTFIISRLCYWILLIIIVFFIGKFFVKNTDYSFKE